jgi:adenylate cyclase
MPKRLWTAGAITLLVLVVGGLAWWQPWVSREEPASIERMAFPLPDKPSIAVLPFNNLSNDPEQEYFSDGLTADIITDISRISGLRVIARHSSFAYKGEGGDIQKIGRELGARYVLEGSVRRSGDRLRINVQLIDAGNGTHMWAERYDRMLTDVLELQDEVTQTIVSALAVNLTLEEERFLDRVRTANPDAYDALLRGLEPLHRFTREDSALAREYFAQAIELDPDYARAHANLSLTHSQDVAFGWTEDPQESIRLALEFVERAETLDDTITQTQFARSNAYAVQKQYEDAERAIRRALELEPNYADGYGELAFVLSNAGELQEALRAIQRAKRLNPRYPFVYLWIEGHVYFLMGQYEKAVASLVEALDRNPAFATARVALIATYGHLELEDEAAWEVDELMTLRPDYSLSIARQEALYQRPEDLEKFIEGLRRAGIPG